MIIKISCLINQRVCIWMSASVWTNIAASLQHLSNTIMSICQRKSISRSYDNSYMKSTIDIVMQTNTSLFQGWYYSYQIISIVLVNYKVFSLDVLYQHVFTKATIIGCTNRLLSIWHLITPASINSVFVSNAIPTVAELLCNSVFKFAPRNLFLSLVISFPLCLFHHLPADDAVVNFM